MKVCVIEEDTKERWTLRYRECSKVQDVFKDDFTICGACVEHNLVLLKSVNHTTDSCVFDLYKIGLNTMSGPEVLDFEKDVHIEGPVIMVQTDDKGEPIEITADVVLI